MAALTLNASVPAKPFLEIAIARGVVSVTGRVRTLGAAAGASRRTESRDFARAALFYPACSSARDVVNPASFSRHRNSRLATELVPNRWRTILWAMLIDFGAKFL